MSNPKRIVLSSDHAAIDLRQAVATHVAQQGWEVVDIGPVTPIDDPEPQGEEAENAPQPEEGKLVIEILAEVEPEMSAGEEIAYEACLAEQDSARLRGEIIVCRRRTEDDAEYSGFDKEKWERDYARRTQGVKTPNVAGAGGTIIMPSEGSLITVTVTQKFGEPPEKALIIDVGALPEAPAGSDADRIARGLAPLGGD